MPHCFRAASLCNARTRRQALLAGDAGYRDATPVFVVGMPRSGSTLVEQILASHSQAFGAGAAPSCCPVLGHSRVQVAVHSTAGGTRTMH